MGKMPVNKGKYTGKYSGSAGRSYSSSRAVMSGGGGGKGPVNKSSSGGDKNCRLTALILLASAGGVIAAIGYGGYAIVNWIWG